MRTLSILQIVPRVPPATCGVGDYSWGIAQHLNDRQGIVSTFLSAGVERNKPPEACFDVDILPKLHSSDLVDFVALHKSGKFDALVLHMSCYGYQKRGVPAWLASGWEGLHALPSRPRMLVMFHELAASGAVNSSAFWLRPLQQWVVRRVARASDGVRTNRVGYADVLRKYVDGRRIDVVTMPVCSNFGEPEVLPKWEDREAAMVMFAWPLPPGEGLMSLLEKAKQHAQRFGIHKLHLIGAQDSSELSLPGIELVRYGFMNAEDISRLLLRCRLAYTAYNPLFFGKSTLMAAFAAHGVVVITQGETTVLPDGLRHGVHVLNEGSLEGLSSASSLPMGSLASNLKQWYDTHSAGKNAESYALQIKALLV